MPAYTSDVVLGRRYRDEQTGFTGTAIYVTFHQHSCERVALETFHDGELKAYEFDTARVIELDEKGKPVTGKALPQSRPGGAAKKVSRQATGRR